MVKTLEKLGVGVAVGVLLVGSGVALADAHHGSNHHPRRGEHIIHGTYETEMTTLMQGSIAIHTRSGQTVYVTLTPKTHVNLEASGTVAALSAAIHQGKVNITAEVVTKRNHYIATAITGQIHVNDGLSPLKRHHDHRDHHGSVPHSH